MTTAVECVFVTPEGDPIVDAPVRISPVKCGFADSVDGIVMPRELEATTDVDGKCTVNLWPSEINYQVECFDPMSAAVVYFQFLVPVSGDTLRLQDLIVE